jgi:hypothetical protein
MNTGTHLEPAPYLAEIKNGHQILNRMDRIHLEPRYRLHKGKSGMP